MRRVIFFFKTSVVLFLFNNYLFAQRDVILYSTYSDYVNQTGEVHNGDFGSRVFTEGITIKLKDKKTKKKLKFKCKDYWGFEYAGALFRTNQKTDLPHRVIVIVDDFVYYENGIAYINYYAHGHKYAMFPRGLSYSSVSKNLESVIHRLPLSGLSKLTNRSFKRFREENPNVEPLFECIDGKFKYKNIRRCVTDFTGIPIPEIELKSYTTN